MKAGSSTSSVNRCDQGIGAVLDALDEAGFAENTLVLFLSDNGMSFPFAKANCYLNSTRTPWIVRWPGHVKPGTVNRDYLISAIDVMPSFLEVAGRSALKDLDGRGRCRRSKPGGSGTSSISGRTG